MLSCVSSRSDFVWLNFSGMLKIWWYWWLSCMTGAWCLLSWCCYIMWWVWLSFRLLQAGYVMPTLHIDKMKWGLRLPVSTRVLFQREMEYVEELVWLVNSSKLSIFTSLWALMNMAFCFFMFSIEFLCLKCCHAFCLLSLRVRIVGKHQRTVLFFGLYTVFFTLLWAVALKIFCRVAASLMILVEDSFLLEIWMMLWMYAGAGCGLMGREVAAHVWYFDASFAVCQNFLQRMGLRKYSRTFTECHRIFILVGM